jgi:hypothetical protein
MNMGVTAMQHQGRLAWDGVQPFPLDLRRHVAFSFTFEVVANITNPAVFNFNSAPASDADVCVPGAFGPVEEVLTCSIGSWVIPQSPATIEIPAGTTAGSICYGTLPCKPDAFLILNPVSGDTGNVRIVATLSGPK